MTDTDQEPAPLASAHPLDLLGKRRRRRRRVTRQADRQAVTAVGAEPLGLIEAQRRPGRVHQEVVPDLRRVPSAATTIHRGGDRRVAVRVELPRGGLHELDSARSYTGANGNVTFGGVTSPTPTQMFDGTQL